MKDQMLNIRNKIIAFVVVVGVLLILLFERGLYSKSDDVSSPKPQVEEQVVNQEFATITGTNPSPLHKAVIVPTQTIEITFSDPLENQGEFKHRFSPLVEHRVEISSDNKTVKIIPITSFEIGKNYTLVVEKSATKFKTGKELDNDTSFDFQTVAYQGL